MSKIKVRKAIHMKQVGNLCIHFFEDDGNLRHLVAVPPGSKRTDIITEDSYKYNYAGSIRKLRGKFIVIKIEKQNSRTKLYRTVVDIFVMLQDW